jgi:hypothetical protein
VLRRAPGRILHLGELGPRPQGLERAPVGQVENSRTTCPNSFPSNASGNLNGNGSTGIAAHGVVTVWYGGPMKAVVRAGLGLIVAIGCAHEATEKYSLAHFDDCEVEGPPRIPCTPETRDVAPSDGRIETQLGKVDTYLTGTGSSLYVKAELEGRALHVMAHPTAVQMGIVILHFPKCIDARAWTGIRFEVRGAFRGCTLKFGSSDVRYEASGASWGDERRAPPETKLVLSSTTRKVQLVEVPFEALQADLRSVHTSLAPPALDRSRIDAMAWQLADDMSGACTADLYIEDLSFY